MLAHPHTSAGRVPTDSRLPLLRRAAAALADAPAPLPVDLSAAQRELDAARCAHRRDARPDDEPAGGGLLAVARDDVVRHVELLRLQPRS